MNIPNIPKDVIVVISAAGISVGLIGLAIGIIQWIAEFLY